MDRTELEKEIIKRNKGETDQKGTSQRNRREKDRKG